MAIPSPSAEQIREFVIAAHGNLAKVKEMLAACPDLLNRAQPWSETDHETAIQAAAQVGSAEIAEYLLAKGAPLEICTAAMLGRTADVERMLTEDPTKINAKGAHGIPLMVHAALSGNVEMVKMLYQCGAREGLSAALVNAVSRRYVDVVSWLLETAKPDLTWKNFQGKTALAIATEHGYNEIAELLRKHSTV